MSEQSVGILGAGEEALGLDFAGSTQTQLLASALMCATRLYERAGEELEQAHDQRPREAEERRSEGRAHAAELAFDHPASGERVTFESDLPAELADVLATLRS